MYSFSVKKMVPLRKIQFATVPKLLWNCIWILYNQRDIFSYIFSIRSCIKVKLNSRKDCSLAKKSIQWGRNFYEITSEFLHIFSKCSIKFKFNSRIGSMHNKANILELNLNFKQLRIEKIQNNLLCKLSRLHNNFGPIAYCVLGAVLFRESTKKEPYFLIYNMSHEVIWKWILHSVCSTVMPDT